MLHSQRRSTGIKSFRMLLAVVFALGTLALPPVQTKADEPGRGLTRQFEINYLKFIADHHFAALRMTELAAGTDHVRDDEISPAEGTSPSPNTQPTPAKATLDMIKSLARRANRTQREEILTAQRFLREWYGINYQPRISPINRVRIEILERAQAGDEFNHFFLEVFSRHHYTALTSSLDCQVASELRHDALERYCRGIVNGQLNQIAEMRNILCDRYQICDYQPLRGIKGRHSGDRGELGRLGVQSDMNDEDEQH
ncbi:MAG: DUF305 domain-containing protein [Pyrinomonadaceae bacterium MAG19_C2-C3]|nr:DUF305 domain-containing protein [Pyrinomonadaceae bacterium MAG19_C2-C3]